MSNLLCKPLGAHGLIHDITPARAGWSYVGFQVHRLQQNEQANGTTDNNEAILVVVEGTVHIQGAEQDFGAMGVRAHVFEQTPPHSVYLPAHSDWQITAKSAHSVVAICLAPAVNNGDMSAYPPTAIDPNSIAKDVRGTGTNTRYIHNIAMENVPVATRLLVTEVFTPAGHWSSYPPHRHDEDNYPNITYLEETYYFRFNPAQGFGMQRIFTEDGDLDQALSVYDHDVSLVPKGHHPCGAPFGYDMYYLNVMAGPLRKWRFKAHPDHAWLME